MLILLVGKDELSRDEIKQCFVEWGHEVIDVCDGPTALERLVENEDISTLYIDWTIEDQEGIDLCEKARNLIRKSYLPIIIFISEDKKEVIPKILEEGADNFVKKPIDHMFLKAQVHVIEQIRKLHGELIQLNETLEHKVKYRTEELSQAYNELKNTHEKLASTYEKLRKTNQEILDMDRMKMTIIDVTSHELRTPLTIIKGVYPLIRKYLVKHDDKLLELLDMAERSSDRLEKLITRAIKFATMSQLDQQLDKEPVAVHKLIGDILDKVKPFIEARSQILKVELPDDLPLISINYNEIFDAIINLMMNAVKFTPDKGTVTLTVNRGDNNMIDFTVTDTGSGISEQDRPYIFKEFFTSFDVNKHSSGDFEFGKRGVGLGLTIAKKFAEMHGGTLELKSTSEKGSCFVLSLPL